ncbi:S24 family peptidase [Capnocytophaga granulosa]|uniref:S24 family peptidase n=1 Tax=Capnocytophaga granulosa TaxID=45242 RepID=UPI0028EE0372|nr:S24 family peptidase [Capnocytophaga granulosa]
MENNSNTQQNVKQSIPINDRFLEVLKHYNYSGYKLSQETNISQSQITHIKGYRNKVSDDVMEELLKKFPEISKDWLLTGNGSMLIPQIEEVVPEEEDEDDLVLFLRDERKGYDITLTDIYEKTRIPVKTLKEVQQGVTELSTKQKNVLSKYIEEAREYFREGEVLGSPEGEPTGYYYPEVYAKAGFDFLSLSSEVNKIPVYVPNFGRDVLFINVYGDSMYPKYKSGDIIGIKPVDYVYLVFGHPYVIVFNNDDINIKYVRKGSDDQHVLLVSENANYEPREYPLSIIRAFYAVRGSFNKERM